MTSLPTLRRKILRSFSVMIFLYIVLGAGLMVAVFTASGTTPKVLHVNYDSISYSAQMREAWHALDHPSRFGLRNEVDWKKQFNSALKLEESNITEPGERELVQQIRALWDRTQTAVDPAGTKLNDEDFSKLNHLLDQLVSVNENGMFRIAQQNTQMSQIVLMGAIVYFILSLIAALFLADGLANRISIPLKSIAEALHRRPKLGKRLKFVEPNTLELLILSNELKSLWDRVAETDKVNVAQIIQQRSRLETVLESVEDALLVVDSQGRITQCNECLRQLIGLPGNEILNQVWTDLPCNEDNYLKLRALLRVDMADSQEIELTLVEKRRQFAARSRPIGAQSESGQATLYLLHDITEKRQRERFRAEFIDLLSHEIKTPLQSLGTASDLLGTHVKELPETLQPLVETIAEDVERIRGVANEFVQVTQSHSKIMKLKLDRISLNQSLGEWIKPFRIIAKDRNVQLNYLEEGSAVIWAQLDTVKFPWAISNLLSNAIRFSPANSVVDVVLTDRNGAVEIQVKDSGPGVSEGDQARIFEPFYQSSTVTSSGAKGLFGIGLTIAKDVVEAHDGRIEYFSRNPQGSEFRIVLPFPDATYGG